MTIHDRWRFYSLLVLLQYHLAVGDILIAIQFVTTVSLMCATFRASCTRGGGIADDLTHLRTSFHGVSIEQKQSLCNAVSLRGNRLVHLVIMWLHTVFTRILGNSVWNVNIVTCMCDYRRGLDCWMDLLTTYTRGLELQVITTPPLTSTHHHSNSWAFCQPAVLTSHSLATDSNRGDSSASHAQVLASQPLMQNSTELSTQVKVTLRVTVSQSVNLAVKPNLGLMTRYLLLFDSYSFVIVGRPLWREDGSVFCQSHCLQ
jgi:hypothetical protein